MNHNKKRRTSAEAWAAFRERVAELGGTVLETEWLGARTPHRLNCAQGHDCSPMPVNVAKGRHICVTCGAGRGHQGSEARFRKRLDELGAVLLEPAWLGSKARHRIRCALGHDCKPVASSVLRGQGICNVCVGHDPASAWEKFQVRMAELGGQVREEHWLGSRVKHRVMCAAGHDCYVRPAGVNAGLGICITCAGQDPVVGEARFRARLEELGAELLDPYRGYAHKHRIRCRRGHVATCTPRHVNSGRGCCGKCMGKIWDAFYVVHNPDQALVKFGITSGDPRPRLSDHRADGFESVIRVFTGLAEGEALRLENEVKCQMRIGQVQPVRGTEYFPDAAMKVLLTFVDGWLP